MKNRLPVGDQISTFNGRWSFASSTAKNFQAHVTKSVPFYNQCHNLICEISDFFIHAGSKCLDIGCSTGELINKLSQRHRKNVKWYGIDAEADMIKLFKKRKIKNAFLIQKNLNNVNLLKYDFITSIYTLQFVKPSVRQISFNKIYKALNWGGAFILFEKTRAPDARFQDILTQLYFEYKEKQGFSKIQILNKSKSLKGVLEPFTTKENILLLKRAGFVDIMPIFKWVCFEGFLCIK